MNRVYRVIWNAGKRVWQVASEFSTGRGKTQSSRALRRKNMIAFSLSLIGLPALAADILPSGGTVVAGSGSISQNGRVMTVNQSTGKLAIDWQSFSIGQGNSVNFVQPSASSVALNRVLGSDVSVIQGALSANGHVFLVNPNGVLFSPTAQVNVGGLVASTLNMNTADFMAGNYTFEGGSSNAVVNQGSIQAARGGNVALLAAKVTNSGTIAADGGNVLLGAGSRVTVDFGGPVKLDVQKAALDALIENSGALRADGGTILLSARAAGDLMSTVINNTGLIRAQTLATGEKGQIALLGDMQNGRVEVGGTLDASAPNGGDGGFIETSAAEVNTAAGLVVNAGATNGSGGEWLIDPYDYTISATAAGNIANTLNTGTSVTVSTQTSNTSLGGSATTGSGDITVASAIAKSAGGDATLTLRADRNVIVNSDITSTSGKLNITLNAANAAGATTGGVDVNANLKSNGGNILIGGAQGASTNGIGYALNLDAARAAVVVEQGKSILSQGGNITINGKSLVGSNNGSYSGVTGGVYIKSDATIQSGTGNLLITGESAGGLKTFGIAFEAKTGTVTTVGSSPGGGNMLMNAVNTSGGTQADRDQGAIGLINYGSASGNSPTVVFQGPSVANWLVYVNGAPQLSGYTRTPQVTCSAGYLNCGYLVVPGANNSYLYAAYQAVDLSTSPIYVMQNGDGSKVYDGTTAATGLNLTSLGGPSGFAVSSLSPYPLFDTASKNAGTYSSLIANSANPKNYTSGSTTYAVGYFNNGNYTITPKALTPVAADKVYDGTTTAAVTATGLVAGDNVTLSGSGAFASKDVGQYNVSISNIALSGADAINYTLNGTSASASASITPRTVSLSASKVYDGNSDLGNWLTLGNLVSGESLSYSGVTANSANVSSARYVNAITLSDGNGGSASNYQLPSLTASGASNTASITAKSLMLSGLQASSKEYDGTTFATLSGGTLLGLISGESLDFTGLSGAFDNKNVGTNKTVSLSGITLVDGTNGLASNYSVGNPAGLTANITAKALTVSGITAADKTYDGGTAATISTSGASLSGLISGDAVNVSASGSFANKDAGSGKTVNIGGIALGGTDAGNYMLTGTSATTTATINARPVTISADDKSKVAGSADPLLTWSLTGGNFVGSDTLAGSLARDAGETAGSYGIHKGSLGNSNYAVSFVDGMLSITPAAVAPNPAAPVTTPAPAPAPAPATSNTAAPVPAQYTSTVPNLPPPSVGGLTYVAVADGANASANTSANANAGVSSGAPQADAPAAEGGAAPAVVKRQRQVATQATAGQDAKFLNVLVVSGGINTPDVLTGLGAPASSGPADPQ